VLKLLKNLYGSKDAGRTWLEHLTDGLISMGFVATSSDRCICIKGCNIIILYVDDCTVMSPTKSEPDRLFDSLEQRGYKLTNKVTMEEYLGIMIDHNDDGSFCMSQPFLIKRIINSIPGIAKARSAQNPACSSIILTKDNDGRPRKKSWNYHFVTGMLNCLLNCTQPEMVYTVHQCARFCNNPKRTHEQAVKRPLRYLLSFQPNSQGNNKFSQGILYQPGKNKSIETYVDASFAGE